MGERKVLNKYFPPDFDPTLIPRRKRPKNQQIEVRMMLPMSIQCETCGEFMYRGKKFNSRKEDVLDEDYHGIRIFRFYIKCVTCSSEITFKTDPKRGDYVTEKGAARNFEPWRENEEAMERAEKEREEAEKNDAMKSLEHRTLDSKLEMDILDALDEMKSINQRHERIDTDAVLAKLQSKVDKTGELPDEAVDEEIAKKVFEGPRIMKRLSDSASSSEDESAHAFSKQAKTDSAAKRQERGKLDSGLENKKKLQVKVKAKKKKRKTKPDENVNGGSEQTGSRPGEKLGKKRQAQIAGLVSYGSSGSDSN